MFKNCEKCKTWKAWMLLSHSFKVKKTEVVWSKSASRYISKW